MLTKELIAGEFTKIQDEICNGLEALDGKGLFVEDQWERPGGGGGKSRVISHGDVIEKGGVNFSAVYGDLPEGLHSEFGNKNQTFFATGVSIVIHPENPWVPIIHMNIRYFEMDNGTCWFGGGIDLTPHYVRPDQAKLFHARLKQVCDEYDVNFYPRFKKWADDYFYITHRNETRGIGGIFFDQLKADERHSIEELFAFVCKVGRTFVAAYTEQVTLNRNHPVTEENKLWQRIRRGRYVEFNLVYDRGTKFGLETNGRIESILMSLPEHAGWYYNHKPSGNSPEKETLDWLKKEIDWIN